MKTTSSTTVPVSLAMLVADFVYRDHSTKKFSILGIFDLIHSVSFPFAYPGLMVYSLLTDGRGKTQLSVRMFDASDPQEEALMVVHTEVDFRDPRSLATVTFTFTNVVFPKPGEYRFELRCGKVPISERRLTLMERQPPPSS